MLQTASPDETGIFQGCQGPVEPCQEELSPFMGDVMAVWGHGESCGSGDPRKEHVPVPIQPHRTGKVMVGTPEQRGMFEQGPVPGEDGHEGIAFPFGAVSAVRIRGGGESRGTCPAGDHGPFPIIHHMMVRGVTSTPPEEGSEDEPVPLRIHLDEKRIHVPVVVGVMAPLGHREIRGGGGAREVYVPGGIQGDGPRGILLLPADE